MLHTHTHASSPRPVLRPWSFYTQNALSACIEAALEETRQAALAQQMEGLGVGPRGGDAAKGEEDGEDMELGAGGGGGAGGRGGKGRGGATGSPGDDEAALARAVRAGAEARMKARRERAAAGACVLG